MIAAHLKIGAPFFLAVVLAGCASDRGATTANPRSDVGSALNQPFKDLNLSQDQVPAVLQQSVLDPYATPRPVDCASLEEAIAGYDAVLGPDLDRVPRDAKGLPRASDIDVWAIAGDGLASFIPFRGVVRRVSGSQARDEALRQAILSGYVRRAYLKGIHLQLGCSPPAVTASRQAAG